MKNLLRGFVSVGKSVAVVSFAGMLDNVRWQSLPYGMDVEQTYGWKQHVMTDILRKVV